MLTGTIRSQVDKVWDAFWAGGIANPLSVIEQITYLLFARRLDELQTALEKKAHLLRKPLEDPIFHKRQQRLREDARPRYGSPFSRKTSPACSPGFSQPYSAVASLADAMRESARFHHRNTIEESSCHD